MPTAGPLVCTPVPLQYPDRTQGLPYRNARRFQQCAGALLIEKDHLTLPQMLHKKGYATAAVGKWHLSHQEE